MPPVGSTPRSYAERRALLGRSTEVARLIEIADQTVERGAQMAIVSGEAGIGKTSLANEALAQLVGNGWGAHVGYCIEYAHRSVPFGPIVSILRSVLLDNLDEMDEIIGRRRDDLSGLLPELHRGDVVRRSLAGDVDRLFDAIGSCLTEASLRRPALLLIEDFHWADAETRDLTTSLVRHLGSARVLLIIAERTGVVDRDHVLHRWLAEHQRWPNVHHFALTGLSLPDLALQAQLVLDRAPEPDLIDELMARTGGNPYFAEELLVARRQGGLELPASLADFLTSRLQRLGTDERDVLRALAIAGGAVSHRTLTEMLPALDLGELIRSLFNSSILVLEGTDYAFGHGLLREAVLRDILPFERADLHRRAAEAIEADPRRKRSLSDLSSLALHWAGADDPDRSLAAAVTAAEAAADVAAHESAAELAVQALSAWPLAIAPEELTGLTHDQLLLNAADWLAHCFRGLEAIASINDALSTWAADLPPGRRALLLAWMAPIQWDLGNAEAARVALAEAKRLVPAETTPEAAQVYHRLSKQAVADGRIEPARHAAEKAIEIATVVGPEVVLVEAMTTKALALAVTGDLEDGLSLAAEARSLALRAGLVAQVANSYRTEMLVIVFQHGRTEAALEASRAGLAYAQRHCGPQWRSSFRLDLCLGYVEAGHLNNAAPLFVELMESELETLRRLTVLQAAGLYSLATNSLDMARAFLSDATGIAGGYNSPQETGYQARLLAELARRDGRIDDAIASIDEALRLQLVHDNLTYTRESILEKIRIARECLSLRHRDAERVLSEARRLVDDFEGAGPANVAMRDLMELELASIAGTIDLDTGRVTIEALEGTGYLLEAAEACLLVIEHQTREAEPDRVALAADIAALGAMATTHGMLWVVARLAELARTAGLPFAGLEASLVAVSESPPSRLDVLTAREREVMALVAEGLTNKGIGERLFVSPRTVSTHISNLLAKLAVTNRGEAAAEYHRLMLADAVDAKNRT